MALLGNGFDDPQSAAIMALSAGLLGRNFAGGLMGANQAYAQGKEAQRRAAMDQMQLDMVKEDREFKRKAMEMEMAKKAEGQAFLRSLMGGGETSYSPGQLGSGSFGVVANADPLAAAPRRAGGLANATPEQIAMAKVYGFDLTEPWKVAKQGFELKPNSYRVDPGTNRREYIPDVKEGITMDPSGRVVNMPGATDALMERTMAAEAAKALLASAGRLNLRDQPDGTQVPVSELSENPTLRNVLGSVFGGAPIPRAATGTARPAAPVSQPSGANVITPDAQRVADQEAMRMIRSELANTTDPATKAGLERELARFEAAQSRPGFPTATARVTPNAAPAQGAGYGKTTAQKIAEKASEEKAVGTAKSEVSAEAARQKDIQTANKFLRIARQAGDIMTYGEPTESGAGRMRDAAMGFFGQSTPGADQAQRLKALGGWLVANVPRMEGPQSNFDVANYQVMAADVGNDALPLSRRKAALESIVKMFDDVASGGATKTPSGSAPGVWSIQKVN